MDLSTILAAISSCTVNEHVRPVEAICDRIATETKRPELTNVQRQELERRLATHTAAPEDVITWEEVKEPALVKARR